MGAHVAPDGTRTALELLGVTVVLTSDDPRLTTLVRRLWAPFVVEEPTAATGAPVEVRVARDGDRWQVDGPADVAVSTDPAQMLSAVATTINGCALGGTRYFATHAAVVASGARSIALVATSGTGKSTLTTALLQAGMDYVSDEALVLREDGRVVAYPRPLGLLPWTRRVLGLPSRWSDDEETQVSAAELGAAIRTDAPTVTDVVLLRRDPGTALSLRPVERQEAAAELLRRSFNHHRDPATAFGLVHRVAASARAWVLTVGDPRDTARRVVGELGLDPTG